MNGVASDANRGGGVRHIFRPASMRSIAEGWDGCGIEGRGGPVISTGIGGRFVAGATCTQLEALTLTMLRTAEELAA